VGGENLGEYARVPKLDGETLVWESAPSAPLDETMLRPTSNPFRALARLLLGRQPMFHPTAGLTESAEKTAQADGRPDRHREIR